MVELGVQIDKNKYSDLMRKVSLLASEDQINKAINRAAKRAADAAKTETVKQISSAYTLTVTDIREAVTTRNLKGGDVGAAMQIESSPFSLPKFTGVTPKAIMPPSKEIVNAQVKKGGGAQLKRSFVAKMKNGHVGVYERETDKGLPLEQHFGPSVPGMFGREKETEINKAAREKAGETLNKRLIHELERLMYG